MLAQQRLGSMKIASLESIGDRGCRVDTDFKRRMHGEPSATGLTRGEDCVAFTGIDVLPPENKNEPIQNRRRRSSDSAVASSLTISAHLAGTLLIVAVALSTLETRVDWQIWYFLAIGSITVHWAIARFAAGRTFARIILPMRLHETLNTIPDGLMLVDEQDRIVMANDQFLNSTGMSHRQVVGRTAKSLPWVRSESASRDDMPWTQTLRNQQPQSEQLMRFRTPDGNTRFFAINSSPLKTDQDGYQGAMVTLRDVTQIESRRREVEQMMLMLRSSRDRISSRNRELQLMADEDPLTGCFNRRAFFDRVNPAWQDAVRDDSSIACLMIDVDHFKQVNDLFGHQVGDKVLKAIAAVLKNQFDATAIVGRYGGEEFCVMIPEANLHQATKFSTEVLSRVQSTHFDSQPGLSLSVSVGVAVRNGGADSPEDVIRQADECLYLAKQSGRNRVVNRTDFLRIKEEQAEGYEADEDHYLPSTS